MKLHLIIYFKSALSYIDKIEKIGAEFSPVISVSNFAADSKMPSDTLYIVDAENPDQLKYLARLDPFDSEAVIRQAIVYALAGKFNDIGSEKSKKIYRGGDPTENGIFDGIPLDLPFTAPELGDAFDKLINALKLNWIPWYAWAGLGGFLLLQSLSTKGVLYKAIYGAGGAFLGYKAITKYRQK